MKLGKDYIAPIGKDLYVINTGDWRYQRPVTDSRRCAKCGLCWIHCPTQCIEEQSTHFQADYDFCKGCGICAHECPSAAISMVEESRE
jgi:2-oxoacid:acceptor oxidoreductase delta subunit (pyruvate/2-ketoisovalerate family)